MIVQAVGLIVMLSVQSCHNGQRICRTPGEVFNVVSNMSGFTQNSVAASDYGFPKTLDEGTIIVNPNCSSMDYICKILEPIYKYCMYDNSEAGRYYERLYTLEDDNGCHELLYVCGGGGSGDMVMILFREVDDSAYDELKEQIYNKIKKNDTGI